MRVAGGDTEDTLIVLVSDVSGDKRYALRVANKLRHRGLAAIREIVRREFPSTVEFAASEGIKYILRIDKDGRNRSLRLYTIGEVPRRETVKIRDTLKPAKVQIERITTEED